LGFSDILSGNVQLLGNSKPFGVLFSFLQGGEILAEKIFLDGDQSSMPAIALKKNGRYLLEASQLGTSQPITAGTKKDRRPTFPLTEVADHFLMPNDYRPQKPVRTNGVDNPGGRFLIRLAVVLRDDNVA
jgi:hypothetical protein